MKRMMMGLMVWGLGMGLIGCAAHQASSPCSNYGFWCSKAPVNAWDNHR